MITFQQNLNVIDNQNEYLILLIPDAELKLTTNRIILFLLFCHRILVVVNFHPALSGISRIIDLLWPAYLTCFEGHERSFWYGWF